jgi:hypothetical protein
MCNPVFLAEPVRVRFNDLLRADRSMPYVPDIAPRRIRTYPRSRRPKWQFIGTAAAALLLAGVLSPQLVDRGVGGSLSGLGESIRRRISQRATLTFADDFRGGLSQWQGATPKRPPKNWSRSADGFIHPEQLGLYSPSTALADYRFEFMAQIDSKSVDWVVRARDSENYYALKFKIVQAGPRPSLALLRHPVIEGIPGQHVQTPLRLTVHASAPYRVTVDVTGNAFRVYIDGDEADYWTDDRLKTGGVGFFSEAGERSSIYWVKVASQDDILGAICGWLSAKSGEGETD